MSEPFLGQVQIFGFGFPPKDWAQCLGQLMPLSQYTALFSLLGVNFGGDGKTTFGLPNFAGSAACAAGQGPGLTPRDVGETFGSETVTLLPNEMPAHSHTFNVYNQTTAAKRHSAPLANDALILPLSIPAFVPNATPPPVSGTFPTQMVGIGGGGQPHPNQQPYLALNFCIALNGIFPQRP